MTSLGNYDSWDTTGLSMGDQYQVRVRYEDYNSTGGWDASDGNFVLRTYTAPTTPVATYPNGGESINTTSVSLTWTGSTDAENDTIHYELQYSNNSGSLWLPIANDSASPYSWDLSSLGYASTYLWRLRACDDTDMCSGYDEADADFQYCIADWTCNLYGDCNSSDLRPCIDAVDTYSCGYNYTGDYTEFTPQACDYCTPDWYCSRHINRCPASHIKDCVTVTDSNGCYLITGLPSDDFDGNYTPYAEVCGYEGLNYSVNDLRAMGVDTLANATLEVLYWTRVIFVFVTIGLVFTFGGKYLLQKRK
jgi:hypothetical protein